MLRQVEVGEYLVNFSNIFVSILSHHNVLLELRVLNEILTQHFQV